MNKAAHTALIKKAAIEAGCLSVGVSKATFLEDQAHNLERWLKEGRQGEMSYMANHFDKRLDPRLLVEGAKSVVSVLFNYYNPNKQADPEAPKISMYAYGKDYHHIIKAKLREVVETIEGEIGEVNGRIFVDSAPVLEKEWAARSGLGWVGKNGNLLSKQKGSFFFLAELIIDLELEYDGPATDHCGSCTKCIEACPTDAIIKPYVVDGSKCISYFTIELKDAIPASVEGQFDNWMFGCDVCQTVCPWNRFSIAHNEPAFNPHPDLLTMSKADWEDLTRDQFNEVFRKSAVKRTRYDGLMRNIKFLGKKNPPSYEGG